MKQVLTTNPYLVIQSSDTDVPIDMNMKLVNQNNFYFESIQITPAFDGLIRLLKRTFYRGPEEEISLNEQDVSNDELSLSYSSK